MALLFRKVLSRGVQLQAPKCPSNFFKFNIGVCKPNENCKYKALITLSASLQRNYSTKKDQLKIEKVDHDKEVIYVGFLSKNVRRIKFLSLCTSVFGLGMQPLIYTKAVTDGQVSDLSLPLFAIIGIFAVATPVLLHIVTKRYVLQVDYDKKNDKYIAHIYNILVMRKKIEFTPEDVTIPTVLGMFANCAIKGKPVFLDAKFFTDQSHYIRIMGYDKPVDFQVNTNESNESTTKKNNNNIN